MASCPRCSAPIETSLGCPACGALFDLERDPSAFEALGLAPTFRVDAQDLRRRVLRFSRITHPDFFATATEEERAKAERASAILNSAYSVLSDDAKRADWLVEHMGGPDENEERTMPQAFLMEVLDWNELLEEARSSGSIPEDRLTGLRRDLEGRRAAALASVGKLLDPLPPPASPALRDARRELNAVRYVDRTLGELEALRLSRAEAR